MNGVYNISTMPENKANMLQLHLVFDAGHCQKVIMQLLHLLILYGISY